MLNAKQLAVFTLCGLIIQVQSHICMWNPPQRGASGVLAPGSAGENRCYLKVGPCGGVAPDSQPHPVTVGQPFALLFQQNANHFTAGNPGQLSVELATSGPFPSEADFQPLISAIDDYNAMNEVTQTNFTRQVTIPTGTTCINNQCVLRLRYISNNPGENDRGEIFYQCSDITLVNGATSGSSEIAPSQTADVTEQHQLESQTEASLSSSSSTSSFYCCAPPEFVVDLKHTHWTTPNSVDVVVGKVYYSASQQLMRIDEGAVQNYLNWSTGYQWVYDSSTGQCGLFGLDPWVDWCFGNANYAESTYLGARGCTNDADRCNVWSNGDWQFEAKYGSCLPSAILGQNDSNQASLSYSNAQVGPFDSTVFFPPAACHRAVSADVYDHHASNRVMTTSKVVNTVRQHFLPKL